jgi:hypothetical protein
MRFGLRDYLAALQNATQCTGLEAFYRAQRGTMPHQRTIYRWHRRLGQQLVVAPVFATEPLGLSHVHAFLTNPAPGWDRFPYAVERAWVTSDCVTPVLYLHCVVPTAHQAVAEEWLRGMTESCDLVRSVTGWERLDPHKDMNLPPVAATPPRSAACDRVLRDTPLVVPAVFEAWGHTQSLEKTWRVIKQRLGSSVRTYLPRQHYYPTNGKQHVKHAFDVLSQEGLFVQYSVRYRPLVEGSVDAFVLIDEQRAGEFVKRIRRDCTMIATHPGAHECLCRVAGGQQVFDAVLEAGGSRVFWVNHRATDSCPSRVRFAYEQLFDPRTGAWLLPEEPR